MNEESKRFVSIGLLVMLIIALVFTIPIWIRSEMRSENEGLAIRNLREIWAAQARGEAGLIGKDLARDVQQGYIFTVSAGKKGWTATATPVSPSMGERNFIIDGDGVVRFSIGDPATLSSPVVE